MRGALVPIAHARSCFMVTPAANALPLQVKAATRNALIAPSACCHSTHRDPSPGIAPALLSCKVADEKKVASETAPRRILTTYGEEESTHRGCALHCLGDLSWPTLPQQASILGIGIVHSPYGRSPYGWRNI